MKNMVSEDLRKILALIIVTLSFLSLPVLLFFFAVMILINVYQIVQFYNTKALADALMAIFLTIVNTVLFFAIWALIRWVRE